MSAVRLLAVLGAFAALTAAAAAAPSREPRKVITPAGQARAKRIAVRTADLPGFGWKAEPSRAGRSNPRCSYYDPDQSELTESGDYTSPDFTRPDGMYVSSTVGIFASARQAKSGYSRVVRPQLPRCPGEIIRKSDPPGKITVRAVGTLSFPRYGDRSAAFRVVFSIRYANTTVPATIDLVVNRGAVDVAVLFGAAGSPVPARFERQIVGRVAARMP